MTQEEAKELALLLFAVESGVYTNQVKTIAENSNHYESFEFVKVLAGGNLEFPKQVIEIAKEKLEKDFPQFKG